MQTWDTRNRICAVCGANLPPARILIEYERYDGSSAAFAKCPRCRDVVHTE